MSVILKYTLPNNQNDEWSLPQPVFSACRNYTYLRMMLKLSLHFLIKKSHINLIYSFN